MKRFSCLAFFLMAALNFSVWAESPATKPHVRLSLSPEYTRSFGYAWTVSADGGLDLWKNLSLNTGLGWWGAYPENEYDDPPGQLNYYLSASYRLPFQIPGLPTTKISIGLLYNYNGLFLYNYTMNALVPSISIKGRWAGFILGLGNRYTSIDNSRPLYETILTFAVYANVYSSDKLLIGFWVGTYDSWTLNNLGDYYLRFYNKIAINSSFSLSNEVNLYQTGSGGLTAIPSGLAFKEALTYSW
jgi:hypothetical protein